MGNYFLGRQYIEFAWKANQNIQPINPETMLKQFTSRKNVNVAVNTDINELKSQRVEIRSNLGHNVHSQVNGP